MAINRTQDRFNPLDFSFGTPKPKTTPSVTQYNPGYSSPLPNSLRGLSEAYTPLNFDNQQGPINFSSNLAPGGDINVANPSGVPTNDNLGVVPQDTSNLSGFDITAKGLGAIGSLGQGYAAIKGLELGAEQNKLARQTSEANIGTQSRLLGTQLKNKEYRRLINSGSSAEEAEAGGRASVEKLGLPSNLSGDSFKWSR